MCKFLALSFLFFMLLSCDSGLYSLISRPQKAPDNFAFVVDSFNTEYEIYCSWEADILADKYILLRSEDSSSLNFQQIYSGEALSYVDTNLKDNTQYIYRLDKVRGEKRFVGNRYYLGVFGQKKRDAYEPNNSIETATYLESPKQANLYYYTSAKGIVVYDIDWYQVRIKAHRMVNITLTYDAVDPVFKVTLPPNGDEQCPANNHSFEIRNNSNEEKDFYFNVQLDKGKFTPTGSAAFFTYTVKLVSETAVSD